MFRLIGVPRLCLGIFTVLFLELAPRPAEAFAVLTAGEEEADRTEPMARPQDETPPADRRRRPRNRAEEDLPTRDLVLRENQEEPDPTPAEKIIEALEKKFDVDFQKRPLRECLKNLAQSAEINLWFEEDADRDIAASTSAARSADNAEAVTVPAGHAAGAAAGFPRSGVAHSP